MTILGPGISAVLAQEGLRASGVSVSTTSHELSTRLQKLSALPHWLVCKFQGSRHSDQSSTYYVRYKNCLLSKLAY